MAHAVRLAPELDEPAVVDDAVDDRRRHLVVPEYRPPAGELQVRGDHDRLPLVGVGEDLEHEARPVGVERQEAELIDDEQGRAADLRHLPVDPALVAGAAQAHRQRRRGEEAGLTRYPLDEELDLPAGDRVSPSARSFLATCGADAPFARTAELMAIAGGSPVSATTVMDSVRSAGEAIAGIERARARDLFRDGVAPRADSAAEEVLVEADGTWVRMRDGTMAEVKAVVAYAGKEDGRRREPVRLGCVGEAPGDFWEAEQQHMYKVRMGSFPCAWSPAGADAMVRLRSWLGSGFALPARTRESAEPPRRRERRERKLARHLARRAGGRVKSEGKGWEYPLAASLVGFRADVRYEAAGAPLGW